MSFRDQLRDWLGGAWEDFWDVPKSTVLLLCIVILWLGIEAYWRTSGAMNPSTNLAYHAMWPLRLFLGGLVITILRNITRNT